jgi:chemotaxis protein MotA
VDKTTIPGLLIGFGCVLASVIIEGGSLAALLNVPAAILVFGGTLGASMIGAHATVVLALPKILARAVADKSPEPTATVETFVRLADKARREGLLALEQEATELEPFARKGVLMVVDGNDPSLVRDVLEAEIDAMQRRHHEAHALLESMGGFAPTKGIIGTVMGLVNVLSKLEDPGELGHSIAVAFIATLYGVSTANLIWLPLASKLKQKTAQEAWLRSLTVDGVMSVQAGDNPRIVREKLEAQLPPHQRTRPQAEAGAAPVSRWTASALEERPA